MKQFIKDIKNSLLFTRKCGFNLFMIGLLGILAAVTTAIIPTFTGTLVNEIIQLKYQKAIINMIIAGSLELLLMVLNIFSTKSYLAFRKQFISNIRIKICKYILNLQLKEYQKDGQGNVLINKIKSDSTRLSTYLNKIKDCSISALGNISILFIIFCINYIIGFCYLIFMIVIIFVKYYGIKKSLKYTEKKLDVLDQNYNLLNQIVKGAKDIKILKLKDKFENKTNTLFDNLGTLEYKSTSYQEYSDKIASFLESVFQGIIVLISIILIRYNLLSAENFIIIFMYRSRIFSFPTKFSTFIVNYKQYSLSLNRILSIINCESEQYGNENIDKCTGTIELKNVNFSYNNKVQNLKNINLKVKENTFISIVGSSGAGKTTIFSLITKILTPNSGDIYLDNIDINDLTENSIRNNISLVTQQPFIFNLSIKENLEIINDDFDKIKEVCHKVGLDKKIEKLENGYDTILDEDATNLSGGEKQRLAIARAILANTKIILLDEITNNLDKKSIKSIMKLLNSMKNEYTIVMITHDTNIAEYTDRIIILENGTIVGDGNPKELLNNKYYQKMHRSITE